MQPILPFTAALAALGAGSPAFSAQPAKPVNFVVIYLDDMGYGDLTITGATGYRTPNLDRLALPGHSIILRRLV